jgi:HAD superfamily phosphoserine phosphatase-like hydrolase
MAEIEEQGRPYAVFDIDGTIIRWQLYHAIVDELARNGHIAAERYQLARTARMAWKKRADSNAFHAYEQQLIAIFDEAIVNIDYNTFLAAVRAVFNEYGEQTYTYTRDLITSLKAKGYLLFAVSASQIEIVQLLAEQYGFDDYAGSFYEVINGSFSGSKEPLLRGRKPEVLAKLVIKHGATQRGSIGVGDSESDIPLLESTETAIAFNPSRFLYEHAKAKNWQIVLERKNVVYTLKPSDDKYILGPDQ